ncbi:rhodanese-like domain-containing protein [Stomatohabitans albus]|uniref:rhodanese-like domain-containing protein n=1 Tax=Stomatohabitans albus TaxID=3110766 RepID=UPI00300DB353
MTTSVTYIAPSEALQMMHDDPDALMVDVRTFAESVWVGVPDLSSVTSRDIPLIPWELVPGRSNPQFFDHIEAEAPNRDHALIVFSRSGKRSGQAAAALVAHGYTNVYDMADGFDGERNGDGRRSTINGWRASGLPWFQQ